MSHSKLSRRVFLTRSAALGCSAAASPLLTPMSFAAAPWQNRLVVIILRGGMDGLDVVQPYGDPALPKLRQNLGFGEGIGAHDLDGFFALHPALGDLMPMWRAGELSFAHAVSTPYRDKRSHFDGQDLLEAGTPELAGGAARDGWLNRMLQNIPGLEAETAYAIGHDEMLLTKGAAQVAEWSPDVGLSLSPQALRLAELVMHEDPLFQAAFAEAMMLTNDDDEEIAMQPAEMGENMMQAPQKTTQKRKGKTSPQYRVASFAAQQLRQDTRIAAFSLNGWDTHQGQARNIDRALGRLSETLVTLKAELGPVWAKTTVVAMTEFGRTARENGTKGTDHGTGGAMLFAGGAVRGGRVYGEWPGLSDSDLYQGRDLMPVRDVRAYAAWAMRGAFGLDASLLEQTVFPGVDLGMNPKILL